MTNNLENETIEELRKLIAEKQKVIEELKSEIKQMNNSSQEYIDRYLNKKTGESK